MTLSDPGRVDDPRTQNALEKIRGTFPLAADKVAAGTGSDDDVLTKDSTQATGWKWAASGGGPPTGAAGGVLDGTYPDPGLAASVAGAGLTETTNVLAVGAGTGITVSADAVAIDDSVVATDAQVATAVSNHESDTTSVHGIADTSTLYRSGGTDVAVADGGTGASTAADARTNLGLVIGTNVQAYDGELAALAGLTSAADSLPYFTGSGTAALTTLTAFIRTLLDDADQGTARTTLGVGTADSPQFAGVNVGAATDTTITRTGAGDVAVEGNAIYRAGGTDVPVADGGTGASDASTARTNLGLAIGTNVQAYDGELAALAGLTSAADKGIQFTGAGTAGTYDLTTAGKALLDDASASAQRTTLGLGDVSTLDQDDSLDWSIDLDPFLTPATQTNWSTITIAATVLKCGYLISSGAQNDEIGWDVTLAAGTWTLAAIVLTGNNAGIITASLDGSSIGTIDLYSAGLTLNVRKTITGVSVATTGKKRLLLKMASKNASSANYFGFLVALGLRRTA